MQKDSPTIDRTCYHYSQVAYELQPEKKEIYYRLREHAMEEQRHACKVVQGLVGCDVYEVLPDKEKIIFRTKRKQKLKTNLNFKQYDIHDPAYTWYFYKRLNKVDDYLFDYYAVNVKWNSDFYNEEKLVNLLSPIKDNYGLRVIEYKGVPYLLAERRRHRIEYHYYWPATNVILDIERNTMLLDKL